MSDPKRATLITVGAPKSAKNNVKKTVRLTINLDESNESKYPELNYKELVIAEERKKRVENGKTSGLDPFSDNDEDVQRVARKFEQKYGGKSTYGRKGRSKVDDFADIGAGYDESDSFIDNTHGYDEMIPPECDTFYGGFYINCGSLEFKNVPDGHTATSDAEPGGNRRNKRRISSSSSEEESSESSSDSESQEEKDPKAIANGAVDSHETEHRKKKNKKVEKKKAKKVRRNNSSAATSGKQTSDDNAQGDGESADSRTSQSDSLTSKPAPSSENAITSDSSRDVEAKVEVELPSQVLQVVEALEAAVSKQLVENPNMSGKELFTKTEQWIIRMERVLSKCEAKPVVRRCAWSRAATTLSTTRTKLLQQVRARLDSVPNNQPDIDLVAIVTSETPAQSSGNTVSVTASATTTTHKRKQEDDPEEDFSRLTDNEREAKILETLQRLKTLIDDRKPGMIATYNAECERVQEERKKIQQMSAAEGAPMVEKRLPKRRFPWCSRTRALLSRLRHLAPHPDAAARLLATRVLPLFPAGFVRMPTLLRQADLSKDVKVSEIKRQRLGSSSQPTVVQSAVPAFTEPIQFPSSLTVTTSTKASSEKTDAPLSADDTKYKSNVFSSMLNSYNLSKELVVEKPEKKDIEKKDDLYVPPNNIGSITITPVPNQIKIDKKSSSNDKGFIRVKSPAALNEMVNKKDKPKKEKNNGKEKTVDTPLHIDTNCQSKEISKKAEITQKQIESMRVSENNIPRPTLVPVQHSPTFAKPDKRPPEAKKKKDIVIVSDVDPLGDNIPEPLAIDDSSSDVEVVEEKTDKSEKPSEVPSKDKSINKKVLNNKIKGVSKATENKADAEETTKDDFDAILRNIREMESSQDPSMKMNSNSYSGVITNAKHEKSSTHGYARGAIYADTRSDRDKFAEPASLRRTDGCNKLSGANTSAVKMIKS